MFIGCWLRPQEAVWAVAIHLRWHRTCDGWKLIDNQDSEHFSLVNMSLLSCSGLRGSLKRPVCPRRGERIKKLWGVCVCVCVCVCVMEYYSAMKGGHESLLVRWLNLQTVTEWSESERDKDHILTRIYGTYKDGTDEPTWRAGIEMRT